MVTNIVAEKNINNNVLIELKMKYLSKRFKIFIKKKKIKCKNNVILQA